MTKFVDAYSRKTGAKQVVPASWLDLTEPPFDDLQKTPRQKARDTPKPASPETKEAN